MERSKDQFFQKAVTAILAELKRRNATANGCERCGTDDWGADLVAIPANPLRIGPLAGVILDNSYIPVLSICCKNCGNTHFHSLLILDPQLLAGLGIRL